MLSYTEFKKAEADAIEVSRRQRYAPMAIVRKDRARGWWDFDKKPYAVVPMTAELKPEDIIVGGIVAGRE